MAAACARPESLFFFFFFTLQFPAAVACFSCFCGRYQCLSLIPCTTVSFPLFSLAQSHFFFFFFFLTLVLCIYLLPPLVYSTLCLLPIGKLHTQLLITQITQLISLLFINPQLHLSLPASFIFRHLPQSHVQFPRPAFGSFALPVPNSGRLPDGNCCSQIPGVAFHFEGLDSLP